MRLNSLAFAEGFQDGESVNAVLQLLEVPTNKKVGGRLQSGVIPDHPRNGSMADSPPSPIRAAGLRDAVRQGDWSIAHLPGAQLVADGGTKAVTRSCFSRVCATSGHGGCGRARG